MDVSITPEWESFVEQAVEQGRFDSSCAVVTEGLRLLDERERKLKAMRDKIDVSLASDGFHSDDEIAAEVAQALDAWEANREAA